LPTGGSVLEPTDPQAGQLVREMMLTKLVKVYAKDEHLIRSLIFPEEDRFRVTGLRWQGGYRWFRSPNVYCLEHYRRILFDAPAGRLLNDHGEPVK